MIKNHDYRKFRGWNFNFYTWVLKKYTRQDTRGNLYEETFKVNKGK